MKFISFTTGSAKFFQFVFFVILFVNLTASPPISDKYWKWASNTLLDIKNGQKGLKKRQLKKFRATCGEWYEFHILKLHFEKLLKTVINDYLLVTCMYVSVCYLYATRMYSKSYVPVCVRVLLVCYPYVPVWCFSQDLCLGVVFKGIF